MRLPSSTAADMCKLFSTDIGNLASVEAATKAVLDAYGQIDVLINNAGVAGPNVKMWEFPPDAFAHMMHVNVDGTFYCCRTIVPHMIARNYGRIAECLVDSRQRGKS